MELIVVIVIITVLSGGAIGAVVKNHQSQLRMKWRNGVREIENALYQHFRMYEYYPAVVSGNAANTFDEILPLHDSRSPERAKIDRTVPLDAGLYHNVRVFLAPPPFPVDANTANGLSSTWQVSSGSVVGVFCPLSKGRQTEAEFEADRLRKDGLTFYEKIIFDHE